MHLVLTRGAMASRLMILTICIAVLAGFLAVHATGARASTVCNISFDGSDDMNSVAELQASLNASLCSGVGAEVIVTFSADLTWEGVPLYLPKQGVTSDANVTLKGPSTLDGGSVGGLEMLYA